MNHPAAALLAVTALITASCAARTGTQGPPADATPRDREVTLVRVTNDNTLDVHVYAVAGGQVASLGQVSTAQTVTFPLPSWLAVHGRVRLLADPVGSVAFYVSPPVLFTSGQQLDMRIAGGDLALSSVAVLPARAP